MKGNSVLLILLSILSFSVPPPACSDEIPSNAAQSASTVFLRDNSEYTTISSDSLSDSYYSKSHAEDQRPISITCLICGVCDRSLLPHADSFVDTSTRSFGVGVYAPYQADIMGTVLGAQANAKLISHWRISSTDMGNGTPFEVVASINFNGGTLDMKDVSEPLARASISFYGKIYGSSGEILTSTYGTGSLDSQRGLLTYGQFYHQFVRGKNVDYSLKRSVDLVFPAAVDQEFIVEIELHALAEAPDGIVASNFLSGNDYSLHARDPLTGAALEHIAFTMVPSPTTIADFKVETAVGLSPFAAKFTNLSKGVNNAWQWDFGDGSTST